MQNTAPVQANSPTRFSAVSSVLHSVSLKVRLKLAYARVLGIKRASYKDVWNKISTSDDLAMIGVAGFADKDAFFQSGEATAQAMREMLSIEPQDTVLEIGCGVGRIGRHLAPLCARWIGTDISSEMLRFARENLQTCDNVSLIELPFSTLSEIADASVDKVYCSAVFMHLDEWDRYKYVTEAYRILKPSGRCYVDNINLAGDVGWSIFAEMTKFEPELRPPNISKSSTAEELSIYLHRAGFLDVETFPGAHFVGARGRKPFDR